VNDFRPRIDPSLWSRHYDGPDPDAASAVFRASLDAARRAIALTAPFPAGPWLDVGAGTGAIAGAPGLEDLGVISLDRDVAMCSFARRRSGGRGRFVAADARRLPFPGGSLSGISAVSVAGDLEDPRATLNETARALKPGAPLIATFSSRYSVFGIATLLCRRLFFRPRGRRPPRYRAFSASSVLRAFRRSGLDPIAVVRYSFFIGFGPPGRERRIPSRPKESPGRIPLLSPLLARNFVVTARRRSARGGKPR